MGRLKKHEYQPAIFKAVLIFAEAFLWIVLGVGISAMIVWTIRGPIG